MLINKMISQREYGIRKAKADLKLSVEIGVSSGPVYGRLIFRQLAFMGIPGLRELIDNNELVAARDLFIKNACGRSLDKNNSKFDKIFPKTLYLEARAWYWFGSAMIAAMDSFPELELNIFHFPRLPKGYQVKRIFNKNFVERQNYKRTGKYFILDQAKKYFVLNSDAEAIWQITRKLGPYRGKRIFSPEEIKKAKNILLKKGII